VSTFRRQSRGLGYTLPVVCWLLGIPQVTCAKDFLWRVRTNDSVVYLAGSFHELRPSDESAPPFPIASFEDAFQKSQQVVLEANSEPADQAAVERYYIQKALYAPGAGSIRDLISATTYLRLRNLLIANGIPGAAVDRLKPWFASLVVHQIFAERKGFDSELGIDERYYDLAGQAGKTRLYLETPYQHVNVIASTPQNEWAAGLASQIADRGNSIVAALEVYKSGDVTALSRRVASDARQGPGITQGLLVKRNLRWLPKIEAYLQQSQTTMVVAGAAHMVRATGLVSLLKKKGYDVLQLPGDAPTVTALTLTYQTPGTNAVTVPIDVAAAQQGPPPQVTIPAGSAVTLAVTAAGDGVLTYVFQTDSVVLQSDTANVLQRGDIQPADSGNYGISATSEFGAANLLIQLTVTN